MSLTPRTAPFQHAFADPTALEILPMTRFRHSPLLLAALLLIDGCTTGERAAGWQGSVRDSAGIELVLNPEDGLWHPGEEWRFERDLVIGGAEGAPEYLFGKIAGICLAADGRIFVVDQMAGTIRAFAPAGTYLAAFGSSGSGPGDLGAEIGGCRTQPGDTLVVLDLQNFRVSRFTTDGQPQRGFPIDLTQGIPVAWDVAADGTLAVQLRYLAALGHPAGQPDLVVRWDGNGIASDTLLRLAAGGGTDDGYVLPSPTPQWTMTDDGGSVFGVPAEYRFAATRGDGTIRRIVSKDGARHAVTDADREIFRAAIEGTYPANLVRAMGIRFAETYPAYLRVLAGPEGSIWVQHVLRPSALSEGERGQHVFGPESPETFLADPRLALGAPTWDVFDAEGRYLGLVELPLRFRPARFSGDLLYGVWLDEADVEYVMRLRVTGAG